MGELTDLEIKKLCAQAVGVKIEHTQRERTYFIYHPLDEPIPLFHEYDPLSNDEQMVWLVKRFHLQIGKTLRTPENPHGRWFVSRTDKFEVADDDLNRAVCLCCARMQERAAK